MNLAEKRKLQRRLPLWESAITTADKNDFEPLKEKIDEGRKALGMKPFDYSAIHVPGLKRQDIITGKEIRVIPGLRNKLTDDDREYTVKEVADLKNKMKMHDDEIARLLKMGIKGFNTYKRRNFIEHWRLKDDGPLTVRRYCSIKNETSCDDTSILKMFNIKDRETLTRLKKKITVKHAIRDEISIFSDDYKLAKSIIKQFEKDGLKGKEIAYKMGISETHFSNIKRKLIKTYYAPLTLTKLEPEIFCHLKNDCKMTDKEIMQKYKIGCPNRIKRMKDKYLENYFELIDIS